MLHNSGPGFKKGTGPQEGDIRGRDPLQRNLTGGDFFMEPHLPGNTKRRVPGGHCGTVASLETRLAADDSCDSSVLLIPVLSPRADRDAAMNQVSDFHQGSDFIADFKYQQLSLICRYKELSVIFQNHN